jgi:hypothetical protein
MSGIRYSILRPAQNMRVVMAVVEWLFLRLLHCSGSSLSSGLSFRRLG